MGELFTKYYRLQETNRRLAENTKIKIVSELLEISDDLEHTLAQLSGGTAEARAVQMVANKFDAKLFALGFSRIDALGRPFDPVFHEAVLRREAEGFAAEIVCEELKSGWLLGDRLVRPAVVAVAA